MSYSINYQEKDYNAILEGYLRTAVDNGLLYGDEEIIQQILNGEGGIDNVLIMELAIHSEILSETYKDLTSIKDSFDLNKAKGEDLDRLLEPFISRRNSTYATTEICFQKETNHINSQITIPSSTKITSKKYPEIIFETIEEAIIPPNTEKITLIARCTIPGPEGNIPPGELNTIINTINGITKAYNLNTAIGGRNQEDDNSYRLRGYLWTHINTQGTLMAFKNAIESVASVEDYYIQRQWDGPGTTKIIINPPLPPILETVANKIKNVCAADEEYTIIGAENKPLNIQINIAIKTQANTLTDTKEIQLKVKNAIKTYIEGKYKTNQGKVGGLKLGEDFIPSQATAHIINTLPIVRDVNIIYPHSIVSIDYYQKAVCGEIQIETQ